MLAVCVVLHLISRLMTTPSPQLHTDHIGGERVYWSCEPMAFDNGDSLVVVPANFLSDGLSIPRIFQGVFSKSPSYIFAGMLHDWLYKIRPCNMTRKQCDKLFLYWMRAYGVGWTRKTIYRSVRIGGRKSWRRKYPQYSNNNHHSTCNI